MGVLNSWSLEWQLVQVIVCTEPPLPGPIAALLDELS